MQLPTMATWAWIPFVIFAAFAQTMRNAAQRTLTAELGTLPATLVRFLYGLPFAAIWMLTLQHFSTDGVTAPAFGLGYLAWITLGAMGQIAATALLLLAMKERNFVVAVAYSKTEVLQVALFATLFLHELPNWISALAMLLATAGVVLLSIPKGASLAGTRAAPNAVQLPWVTRASLFGLCSGACFALASVGYRGAALTQPGVSAWVIGAWGVLLAQSLQSLMLGGYLAVRKPGALRAIARAWRLSSVAGTMGAMASIGWFTAFALRAAADVKTLGLLEVVFSYLVSSRLFKETLSKLEVMGLVLVTSGLIVICSQI